MSPIGHNSDFDVVTGPSMPQRTSAAGSGRPANDKPEPAAPPAVADNATAKPG